MAFLEKFLVVKNSKISSAGLGLFSKIKISKGTRIVEYKGRLQSWNEVKHEDGYNPYILRVNQRLVINAKSYKKAFGRFVNDAKGKTRDDRLINNAEYLLDGHKCYLDAMKEISAGEEIMASYGREFWALIKKIQKEKRSR